MRSIRRIQEWSESSMAPLIAESTSDGHRFHLRLRDEWISGANRFTADGEGLFGVWEGEELVAVGGVNRESEDCGRLRRVYVGKLHRGSGIGSLLVRHLIDLSQTRWSRVVLRTNSEAADRFYRRIGFSRCDRENATHEMEGKTA